MKGPFFKKKLQQGTARWYQQEREEDLETLYSLILEARNAVEQPSQADEEIALVAICWIWWPGKPPEYEKEALEYRETFAGIADDEELQERFRTSIGSSLIEVADVKDLQFTSLSDNFNLGESSESEGKSKARS